MYKNKTCTGNNLYCKRIKAIRQHLPQKHPSASWQKRGMKNCSMMKTTTKSEKNFFAYSPFSCTNYLCQRKGGENHGKQK